MTVRRRHGDPYAGIPGRRLFVAVPLPDDALAAVAAIVEEVRSPGLPDGFRDVRWVRLDGLHLTLRFLGPAADELIEPTSAAVMDVAARSGGPIELELSGSGTFPPGGRPRAIWIGVSRGAEALEALATDLETALVPLGWPPAGRPFRAHLTLARCDGLAAGPMVAGRLAAAMAERRSRFDLDRLGLYESVTGDGPARYVPVALARMGREPSERASVYHQGTPDLP